MLSPIIGGGAYPSGSGASILRGLREQSPTVFKVGVDGLVISVTHF